MNPGPRYVYTFLAADGTCLYVGCTNRMSRRFREHASKPWFGDIAQMIVDFHPDHAAGAAAEAALIRLMQPVHNLALTGHDTPKRLPCKRCRAARHDICLTVNRDGNPCECSMCAPIPVNA